jgi:hypothetical protein
MKDLTLYTPVSYNGYELSLNEGEYAVKMKISIGESLNAKKTYWNKIVMIC